MTVRVLIVDDQEPFRMAARMVVEATDGFEVVGESETGEDSVAMASELKPDLVLMDVNLAGIINGLDEIERRGLGLGCGRSARRRDRAEHGAGHRRDVGGGGRLEYTVIGDAVNIAQRLQSEAAGGEIVAAASTVAAAPDVEAEPIGPRRVKGREESVDVYRIVF